MNTTLGLEHWAPITDADGDFEEQKIMQEAFQRVAERVGYDGPQVTIKTDQRSLWGEPAFYMEVAPGPTLYYVKGATAGSPIEHIEASMAHEIAHIIHGDIHIPNSLISPQESQRMETEADRFAARHGYGDQLATFLRIMAKHPQYVEGLTHPSLSDRLRNIQEVQHGLSI